MISKTMYRLRLFIHETSEYYPIHLYALKEKLPTFKDLLNKIEHISSERDINDYRIAINDTNTILCDNESLRNALATNQSNLDIVLYHKSKVPTKLQLDVPQTIPVIKPAVLRWTPAILPNHIANPTHNTNYHSFRIHHVRHTSDDCRKDPLDEPLRKKQRMMSVDHPRKLPDPASPSIRNSINFDHTLHPLEIKRPSTAPLPSPSSSPPFSSFQQRITLPAISSITSNLNSQQLAPIKLSKRSRSSVSSTQHSHNMQQNTVFVCDNTTTEGKVCGQTFRRSYDLSRHQNIHLENRPFCYCEKCGRRFTRRDALRRHERVQGHTSSKQRSMSTSALPTTSVK